LSPTCGAAAVSATSMSVFGDLFMALDARWTGLPRRQA
jgi:hypothetical protein